VPSGQSVASAGAASASAPAPARPKPRTPDEIEADLAATRERLATTVNELSARLQPSAIAERGKERAAAKAEQTVTTVRRAAGLPVAGEPTTGPSPAFLGAVAGAALGLVLIGWWSRRR
jgi:hypothetical protein